MPTPQRKLVIPVPAVPKTLSLGARASRRHVDATARNGSCLFPRWGADGDGPLVVLRGALSIIFGRTRGSPSCVRCRNYSRSAGVDDSVQPQRHLLLTTECAWCVISGAEQEVGWHGKETMLVWGQLFRSPFRVPVNLSFCWVWDLSP